MADTVALSGYMYGPIRITPDPPDVDIWEFELTHPDANQKITFKWTDIWWIDTYPEPYYDQPGGDRPHPLGNRTVWVKAESELIGRYITGDIVDSAYVPPGDSLTAWNGPQMNYAGPQGTSYPPCLCPR